MKKHQRKNEPKKSYVGKRAVYRDARGRFIKRGIYYRKIGVKRRKARRRVRRAPPPTGWATIQAWKAYLESSYPRLIYSEAIPRFLKVAFPTEETFFLGANKKTPNTRGIYRLASIWLVVQNKKEKEFYLMIQTDLISPTITGERLFEYCRRLFEERSKAIQEKTDYLVVREWAAWSGGRV